jgi:glutathione S-transferase
MHAGFQALRRQFPMNMRRPVKAHELAADAAADVRRIETLWGDCRARFRQSGPFLYGAFGTADAMYAPVVSRFHTYGVDVGAATREYMRAITASPEWGEWREAARREPWVIPQDEIDWPAAPRE